jgi:quercetin dioxygenase-like cupin family protein
MLCCHVITRGSLLAVTLLVCPIIAAAAGAQQAAQAVSSKDLMTHDLLNGPDKEVVTLTVTYAAAGASVPHRHDAQVFVYVLEGTLTMQVRGSSAVTLHSGQTFYESPDDVHVVSANASKTSPAKILVVMIKDKGKPATRAVAD